MIKIITTFIILLSSTFIFAQEQNCKVAEDSILALKNRGEIAYYYPTKYHVNQFFYIVFKNNRYTKTQIAMNANPTEDFMKCFNQLAQVALDKYFKVDFFRKSDSILTSYDIAGLGYRNTDFPGGAFALQKFLNKNVSLPKDAKTNNTDPTVKVYYSFVVDEMGKISEIKLIKSNCTDCEEAVLNAIKKLPNFIPATEAGYPKKLKYILPFSKKIE